MVFNQPPDFGISLSHDGKIAKRVNGIANADENPSMPIAGPRYAPLETASTSKVPIMGPVHEKETKASVKAIKNRPIIPPLFDFLSIWLTKLDGSVISKAPKNEMAKTIRITKNRRLNVALLAASFNAEAPKMSVISNPSPT